MKCKCFFFNMFKLCEYGWGVYNYTCTASGPKRVLTQFIFTLISFLLIRINSHYITLVHLFAKNSEFNYLTRKNSEGCTRCKYPHHHLTETPVIHCNTHDFTFLKLINLLFFCQTFKKSRKNNHGLTTQQKCFIFILQSYIHYDHLKEKAMVLTS